MGTRLVHVPFDIETAGFETTAPVTTVGFALPLGCRVFVNTAGRDIDVDGIERRLQRAFDTELQLSDHRTESTLLDAVAAFLAESVAPRDYLLVAYNGERWNGGFDLPFLRTRYLRQGIAWPFDEIPYADLLPLIQDRFNTTVDDTEQNDLVGAYEALISGEFSTHDPFEESGEAVDAFETGAFEPLVAHNVADILRTKALASCAERYCGKAEFTLKSLTPLVRDPELTSQP